MPVDCGPVNTMLTTNNYFLEIISLRRNNTVDIIFKTFHYVKALNRKIIIV